MQGASHTIAGKKPMEMTVNSALAQTMHAPELSPECFVSFFALVGGWGRREEELFLQN